MKTKLHLSLLIAGTLSIVSLLVFTSCSYRSPESSQPAKVTNLAR